MQKPSDSTRLDRLEVQVQAMVETVGTLAIDLKDFASRYQSARTLSFQHVGILVAVLIGIGGVGVKYIGDQIDGKVIPLQKSSEASATDRVQLNMQMEAIFKKLGELERVDSTRNEQLNEVEARFKNVYDTINLATANDRVMVALLWKRTYGEDLPVNAYYVPPRPGK